MSLSTLKRNELARQRRLVSPWREMYLAKKARQCAVARRKTAERYAAFRDFCERNPWFVLWAIQDRVNRRKAAIRASWGRRKAAGKTKRKKQTPAQLQKRRERERKYFEINPQYRLLKTQRSRLSKYVKAKESGTALIRKHIGCTNQQLREHIQSQFKKGMAWNNYGKIWQIDHIIPCSAFDLNIESDVSRCFHFSNLRPMYVTANAVKGDKIEPCQPELIIKYQ